MKRGNTGLHLFFDRGRKTCWEPSIKMSYVSYKKKNFDEFLTKKLSWL